MYYSRYSHPNRYHQNRFPLLLLSLEAFFQMPRSSRVHVQSGIGSEGIVRLVTLNAVFQFGASSSISHQIPQRLQNLKPQGESIQEKQLR